MIIWVFIVNSCVKDGKRKMRATSKVHTDYSVALDYL